MAIANERNTVEDFKREAGRVQGKELVDEVDSTCAADT